FLDGVIAPESNVLDVMFEHGNVRWLYSFASLDSYFQITDQQGNVFNYMDSTDIDDWGACGRPASGGWLAGLMDSSVRYLGSEMGGGSDDDSADVRVTGRFWFDLRRVGYHQTGNSHRFC